MPGYTAALAEMLRDTSSRALFDINMRCPSGKYAIVPRSLAKKSEVLGEMVEAVGDDDDGSSPVAPGGLLNEWISCSSRLQARELDPESTETLASYLKVADFFADKGTMKHLACLLGLRLNRALAEQPERGGSPRVMPAPDCYQVLSMLPSHILAPVLRVAPVTLDQHTANLSPELHPTAFHAHFPDLDPHSKLELDCSRYSAFTCCSLLNTFAALDPSPSKSLTLQDLTLEPTEDSLGMQGLVDLFTAWYAAVGAIRKQSKGTLQKALQFTEPDKKSSSLPSSISIIGSRMHTNHYKLLFQPLPDSPGLERLELRDMRQLPHNSRTKSFIKHVTLIMTSLTNLRSLRIADIDDGNPFGYESRFRDLIESCSHCIKLTELELGFRDIRRLKEAHRPVADCIRHMSELRSLSLDCIDRSWSPEGCTAFTDAIICLPVLTSLRLSEHDPCEGRPWGGWGQPEMQGPWQNIIGGLVGMTGLQRLSLTKIGGPDHTVEPLARAVQCMANLKEFELEFLRDWGAEGVLTVLDKLRFYSSCTKLVFSGKCVTHSSYEASALLIGALVRGFLMPSLHHLDLTLHRDTTQSLGGGLRSLEREVQAAMRVEIETCQSQVVDLSFPSLTHLRFVIEPGAARAVVYAAMHGMAALKHLEFSVIGIGCEAVAGYLSKHEFAGLETGLAVLAQIAPLKTLRGDFQVPRPRQTAMLQLLTQFTTLKELEVKAAPGCVHEGMYAHLPCLENLFKTVPSVTQLTKLHIKHVPLQQCIVKNLAASLRTASSLLDLKFTGFCSYQGTLVLLLHAMAKLTQLQRLRFALEKPEIPYPDGSEELTEAMMDSLSKMISLKYIYIANVPWVSLTEIRCVIRAMSSLRALEFVEFERLRAFTREDYIAVADLLQANPAIRTLIVPSTSTMYEEEYSYHSRHTSEGLAQVARTRQTAQRLLDILQPSTDPLRCPCLAQQARTAGAKDEVSNKMNSWWLMGGDAGRAAAAAEITAIKQQRLAARQDAEVKGCSPKGISNRLFGSAPELISKQPRGASPTRSRATSTLGAVKDWEAGEMLQPKEIPMTPKQKFKYFWWLLCCAPIPETPEEAAKRKRNERDRAKKKKAKETKKAEKEKAKQEANEDSKLTPEIVMEGLRSVTDRNVVRLGTGGATVAQAYADNIRDWTPPPNLQEVLQEQSQRAAAS